ncbi:MAG: hypothetical protein HYY90_04500 [Candidatus Omnitrophica bacterium]|nr:hypothetical protein [Candidatus Omnitrophota bacterium]MBI3083605.1 hypothetical protein [Candidatus Omnitrophota bacterium]
MLELGLEPIQTYETEYVQDEPALEIALPQVFVQPELTIVQRGKLPHAEARATEVFRRHQANPDAPLGPDYQELVNEFQPLFSWAIACWDYLLSTEGCRFLPRNGKQKFGVRGDYSALTDKDYSRMVHGIFRACVFEFAQEPDATSLSQRLRERFWPLILDAYRDLANPPDPRQRTLTPYSYLRCVPYQFLNEFHHDLVYATVQRLPTMEWRAIDAYFLHFFTEAASAEALGAEAEALGHLLRQGLMKLLIHERLVYCLLRQIERY